MSTVRTRDLSALIRGGRAASDPAIKSALTGLAQEAKTRLEIGSRDSRDFFISTVDLLGNLRGSGHRALRVDCLLNCCQYFYYLGDSPTALDPARKAAGLAKQLGDAARERNALCNLGIILADTANFVEAVECYSKAIDMSRELRHGDREARSWVSLSVALIYMSRYQEALECLQQTNCAESEHERRTIFLRAAHNEAICWFNLGDLKRARECAETATLNTSKPTTAAEIHSNIIREHYYVQILLELGEFELARRRAHIAMEVPTAGIPRAIEMQRLIRGLVEAYCGDQAHGLSILNALLDSSSEEYPALQQDVLIALARSSERCGDFDSALGHLQNLLGVSQKRRQQTALFHLGRAGRSPQSGAEHFDLANMRERQSRLKAHLAEEKLFQAQLEMLERLAIAADLRDDPSGQHGFRVGRLSSLLAERLGYSSEQCVALEMAAKLHDIGKSGIPDRIVTSSQSLREGERRLMNAHSQIGSEILAKSNLAQVRLAEEIARCHHERWDGSGYPSGLRGNRIPEAARIVALADVFDAMTHGRPYADAWSVSKALAEIAAQSGTQFDPSMTVTFVELIEALSATHGDLDAYLGQASSNSPFFRARVRIQHLIDGARSAPLASDPSRPS